MSLAGFACAWHYRSSLKHGLYDAVSYVIWPLSAALFMVFIALYSIPTFDALTNTLGVGGILLGFIPLVFRRLRRQDAITSAKDTGRN
jgi:hypothetical protein